MKEYIIAVSLFVAFFGGFAMAWLLRPAIEIPAPVVQEVIDHSTSKSVWFYNGRELPHCGLRYDETEPCYEGDYIKITHQ